MVEALINPSLFLCRIKAKTVSSSNLEFTLPKVNFVFNFPGEKGRVSHFTSSVWISPSLAFKHLGIFSCSLHRPAYFALFVITSRISLLFFLFHYLHTVLA